MIDINFDQDFINYVKEQLTKVYGFIDTTDYYSDRVVKHYDFFSLYFCTHPHRIGGYGCTNFIKGCTEAGCCDEPLEFWEFCQLLEELEPRTWNDYEFNSKLRDLIED